MQGLLAEISRKKKANADLRSKAGSVEATTTSEAAAFNVSSKFIRRGDKKRLLEEEHVDQQNRVDQVREDKNSAMQQQLEERSRKKERKSATTKIVPPPETAAESEELIDEQSSKFKYYSGLSMNQMKTKLRAVGQPVTLFGEGSSMETRVKRLLQAERRLSSSSNKEGDEEDEHLVKGTKHDEEEAELEADDLQEIAQDTKEKTQDDDDSDREDQGKDMPLADFSKCVKFSHIVPKLPKEKIVYKFFRFCVKQWELDLNHREEHEKLSMKGKMETRTQKQCKDYIRPLFKMCKKKEVPFDILFKLDEMVQFCENGDFRSANDKYISTAIGTSPWPIGLTMVGIHERSGREKISTSKVAHMMNNELQRKYLTSVKRLMTYAQNKRPDVPPSYKVLN